MPDRDRCQAAGLAGPAAGNRAGACGLHPTSHYNADPVSVSTDLAGLAGEAKRRAASCSALAASCQAAGDRAGFWHWRVLTLKHQAIYRSAATPGGGNGAD